MRYGIRQLLPETVEMRSGPGCPVCVTANADLDKAIAMAHLPGVIITSFGDMMRVPGSYSTLQQARAEGADVRVVYSTMDAVDIAKDNPRKSVIFSGIGFETTAPTIAASVIKAQREGIENFYVLSMLHRLGCDASLTLGNKKSVDIVVVRESGGVVTIDVKGLAGTSSWPVDNVKKKEQGHFLVFISFLGKIGDPSVPPEVYVVPSKRLDPFVYHSPNGKRRVLHLSRMRKDGREFRDAWHLLK